MSYIAPSIAHAKQQVQGFACKNNALAVVIMAF